MKEKQASRRTFLQALLLSTPGILVKSSPLAMFFESIIYKAYGAEMTDEELNFIGIMMTGAPPRWMYDLPLNPKSGEPFMVNPMVATRIVNGEFRYFTRQIGEFNMPVIWDKMIPTLDGSSVKISTLLNNMIMFRGYNLGVDGHRGNQVRHFKPSLGGPSMDGIVGSKSKRPLPSIACGSSYDFRSPTGSSQVAVGFGDTNPLTTLISNFKIANGQITPTSTSNKEIEDAFDQVLKSFEARAHKDNIPLKSSYQNRLNAKEIFKKQFGDLKSYYDQRFSQYRSLESSCFLDSRFNLGDGIQQHSYFTYNQNHGLPELYYRLANINQRSADLPEWGTNIQQAYQTSTKLNGMAHGLTVAEFLLENKLSSALTLQFNNLVGLKIGTRNNYNLTNDAHIVGALNSLFFYSKYYQVISAGLLEFRRFLESKNLFDKSVIQLSGDFNRCARYDGRGSDHGWQGSNTTVLSGMIKKHDIAGNCKYETTGNYKGSWGKAAPMDFLDGSEMVMGNVASSLAVMLACESPTANFPSLVNKNPDGTVELNPRARAKNV